MGEIDLWNYYYTDFNNDGKTNLIVETGTCNADAKFVMYKYVNGRVKKLGHTSAGSTVISGYPNHNGVVLSRGHMGYETLYYAYLKNGKVKTVELGNRETEFYFMPRCFLKGHINTY